MPDVESYIRRYTPEQYLARERAAAMTTTEKSVLTREVLDSARKNLAAKHGVDLSTIIETIRRAGGIDGGADFPSLQSEAVALSMVDEHPEVFLAAPLLDETTAAAEVFGIASRNPGVRIDLDKAAAGMIPVLHTDQLPRVQMTEPTEAEAAKIAELTHPDFLDFRRPPQYGPGTLLTNAEHANAVPLAAESAHDAVIRLTAVADELAHGSFIGLARHKQQAQQHCEHDDHDHGTAAQTLDVDAEIAKYVAMHQTHHTITGNKAGLKESPGARGQRTNGPWHSSNAPLPRPTGKTRPGRRAPSWAPGNAAAGEGGDLDAGGGADQ